MGVPSMGVATKWATKAGANPTFDGTSQPFEHISFGVQKRGTIVNTAGIRGTRDHPKERLRTGIYEVGGPITWYPSPADLDIWLPRILGGAESMDVFSPTESLETNGIFSIVAEYGPQAYKYLDCRVSRATFRSKAGRDSLLELTIDVVGKTAATETYAAASFGTTAAYKPYIFSDAVFTMVSAARDTIDVEVVIDNVIEPRFTNSRTSTGLMASDRIITVSTTHPFTSDETALYDQALAGASGTIVFTNADSTGLVLTFTFGNLAAPALTPTIDSKGEVVLKVSSTAYSSGSTASLVVTNDAAP